MYYALIYLLIVFYIPISTPTECMCYVKVEYSLFEKLELLRARESILGSTPRKLIAEGDSKVTGTCIHIYMHTYSRICLLTLG